MEKFAIISQIWVKCDFLKTKIEPQFHCFQINVNRSWYINEIWHDLLASCSFDITKLLYLRKKSQKQAQFSLKLPFFMKIWPQITYFSKYLHKNLKINVSCRAPSQYGHFIVTNLLYLRKNRQNLVKNGYLWPARKSYFLLYQQIL